MPFPNHLLGGRPPTQRLPQGPQAFGGSQLPAQQGFIGGNTQSPLPAGPQGSVPVLQGQPINNLVNQQTGLQLDQPANQQFNLNQNPQPLNVMPGGVTPIQQSAIPPTQQPVNPATQPQGPLPQFGLAGAEQAFTGALDASQGALQQGQGSALNTLIGGGALAQGQFDQGLAALMNQNQLAQQQFQQFQDQAQQQSLQAQQQGLGAINQGISAGQAQLSPFAATGQQANQSQAALSGALGPAAQAQAFADFQSSPEQQFIKDEGQLSIINQQAALGGLGGGNVRKELLRFGSGVAAQDFQNSFNRRGTVANRGAQAAGQSAQLAGQGALASGNLISSLGGQRSNQLAQAGQFGANLTNQLGSQVLGARQNLGGLFGNLASQGAGIQQQGGRDASSLFANTGGQIGGARIGAGNQIAGNIQDTTRGLADLANQQGQGLSAIVQRGGEGLSNFLAESGVFSAGQIQQLLPMLTNLTTSQSSQIGRLLQDASNAATAGNLAGTEGQQQLGADVIGAIAGMFSDERLKENIKPVGELDGINFYTWQWNDKMPITELIGESGFGVLAQELEVNHPELVINNDPSGYKKVDYAGLEKLCH